MFLIGIIQIIFASMPLAADIMNQRPSGIYLQVLKYNFERKS